ncbi:MAG TPA: aminotransferase class I/II-fold pyridoxal phosphate-dependent enzyme [Gemmatimonadaceae bacterium]|nr:aminotransferase class I/II-fold pyridoxal phosphate-dependent enzyme [Gemmatimonadaceae bacterium]
MNIREFALERFFAEHEFAARHVLAASDVEGMAMSDVLALADAETSRLWSGLRLGYTESTGLPLLRAEIATLYDGLGADDILTFAGAEEAIFLAMHATLAPGDHVATVWPAYQSLHEVARSIGADVTPIPLDPCDWSLDIGRVADALRPNTRMVVINFPHNPTGAHIDRSQLDGIVDLCRQRGILLFSDEVYRLLEHDPADLLPPAATVYENGVSLGVMSKSFALAGLRIGWIATRDGGLRARIAALKDYTTICSSAPSEILALIALRGKARVLARSREIVAQNLPILREFMSRHAEHLTWAPPRAGSVCFPRFIGDVDAEQAATSLIEQTGVVILPGGRFEYDRAHFRVGFGRLDTAKGLDLLGEWLGTR